MRARIGAIRGLAMAASLALSSTAGAVAQEAAAAPDTVVVFAPRGGSEFWIPFGSMVIPGLGQYIHGATWAGVGYTATSLAGYAASRTAAPTFDGMERDARGQFAYEAAHVAVTASFLSAWDAFHRATPALRQAGEYGFLAEERDDLGDLLTAPLDHRFLGRWTTWINLAFTSGVTAWILSEDEPGAAYPPFRGNDAAFVASLSLNAAVGEEALFRGWLLPMLTQKLGGRFWLANTIQATIFGLGHPQAGAYATVIGAHSWYYGWLTRRNDWSVREAIFAHFWYDALVVTASMLRDDGGAATLMPITIRF